MDVCKNTVIFDTLSLSAFVHIGPYPLPLLRTSTNVTKYTVNSDSWTSSNYQMSVSDCCWHWQDTVLAAGCQWVITIYLLSIPRMPQSTCCELWFIQLVTLSLFLSLSTVLHCYTLWTFALAKTPPLVCFCPHWAIPLLVDVLYVWLPTGSKYIPRHNKSLFLSEHFSCAWPDPD